MKGLVAVWVVLLIGVFALSYLIIDVVYKATINSLKVEDTTPSSLQVKDNFGSQTDNHYKLQPSLNVQEQ